MMSRKTVLALEVDPLVAACAEEHGYKLEALLEILQSLLAERGHLHPAEVEEVARTLRIPAQQAYGVATFYSMLATPSQSIWVCDGPACWLRGAAYARAAIEAEFKGGNGNGSPGRRVERSSCLGLCDRAPAALVGEEQCGPLEMDRISEIGRGWRGDMPAYSEPLPGETRILLANAGRIDPDEIDSALDHGAYQGLKSALSASGEEIIHQVEVAGLRGRGGAGFPTGRKMRFVAGARGEAKYIVCNADESEPLVFKDRVMIDSDPHKILEGMALAGHAVGANTGFIYIRGEYNRQAKRLRRAIQQAEERGWLGERINGSDFCFHVHLHRGAGAYICGEETALLESLEGRRGEPRIRPPFPATEGYGGQPTLVNNLETLAAIPDIVKNGGAWYRSIGNPETPGTKLYTLLGHVRRPGLFEAPYGLTLRDIIEKFGVGMSPGSEFHFALTGGAAGTIVPGELLDIPIDYGSVAKGVSLGAGAFLICDQTVSPALLLREVLYFFEMESCGKCTPCRMGTHQARQLLDRVIAGKARAEDLDHLMALADLLQEASFCGLGQSAAMPIRSGLTHFNDAFKERIHEF